MRLVYQAKTKRIGLVFLLVIPVVTSRYEFLNHSNGWFFYILILIGVCLVLAIFITYQFTIKDGHLIYEVFLLTVPIYRKKIQAGQIKVIKFKRIGWREKGAIIKAEKGVNIRIVSFSPDKVIEDLIHFAHENDIAIAETKRYQALK